MFYSFNLEMGEEIGFQLSSIFKNDLGCRRPAVINLVNSDVDIFFSYSSLALFSILNYTGNTLNMARDLNSMS